MQNLIHELTPFMFNCDTLYKFSQLQESKTNRPKPLVQQINQKPKDLFIPKYKDTLFWCFYIMIKGWEEFFLIAKRSFSIEKEYKISCIEQLRTSKELLKKNRWKRTEIENDLLNNTIISPVTFICLCGLYNINIVLIEDFYYYTYIPTDNPVIFFIKKNNEQYGIYDRSPIKIRKELEDTWEIDNLKKPLRGISAYKVKQLKRICKQLKIDIYKNNRICNKRDIYKLIKSKLNKDFLY